ncbi:peroxidase, partial [Genlisea aurea]
AGSHTIGQARCTTFRSRIYNETNIDASFARARRVNCPISNGTGDGNLAPLDLETPTKFDNRYFKNLVENKGLLHSDQQLYNGAYTDSVVERFVNRPESFERDFVVGMIRMGNISPLTGSDGEIRKSCRRIN